MIRLIKRNPTDKEFLKNIKIQKVKDKRNSLLTYNAYLNNNYIGGADLDLITNTVKSVYVKPLYRLKGLSTFIYNRIEKDLGFKLKPSNELYPDGKEFWKNRLKNPTDNKLLNQIKIKKSELGDGYIIYEVYLNDSLIGKFELWNDVNYINRAWVKDNFQKRGVASYVYDYIENDLNKKLIPHKSLTTAGKLFWKNRNKN